MNDERTSSPVRAGTMGRCPRCGRGRLFGGFLALAPGCSVCGLDYGFAESADGPAVFATFIVGALVVIAAFIVEFRYEPAFWVHMVLWIPLIIGLSLGLLRPLKGAFVALQYRHQAREGRLQ